MRGRLYALLITLFSIPFLVGGILGGFYVGEALQRLEIFGLNTNGWIGLLIDLCLAALGIYVAGLITYAVLLAGATAFFSRKSLEHFASKLPQSNRSGSKAISKPFATICNFFWSRVR